MNEIQSRLLSSRPLLISADGYRRLMVGSFPLPGQAVLFAEDKTYPEERHEALEQIRQQQPGDWQQLLTDDYGNVDLPLDSVAYHRVWGVILADSRWHFSTKQLERDLMEADQNPQVTSHLLHVNSPGGDAYYLDRLSETMRQLRKPVVTLYETMCSAAYHIGCHASRVYATTQFDFVGCIGTMVSFWDFQPYYEKLGIRLVEAKADDSDLKNKMFDDLTDGKPRQYVEQVLNPLNAAFLAEVRAMRPALAALPDDAPVLRGETFYTQPAQEVGLCDGRRTLAEAVGECRSMGAQWRAKEQDTQALYNLL